MEWLAFVSLTFFTAQKVLEKSFHFQIKKKILYIISFVTFFSFTFSQVFSLSIGLDTNVFHIITITILLSFFCY